LSDPLAPNYAALPQESQSGRDVIVVLVAHVTLLKPCLLVFGQEGNLHSVPVRKNEYSMCCCCCMIADDPCSHSLTLSSDAEARKPQQAVKQYWMSVLQIFIALAGTLQ